MRSSARVICFWVWVGLSSACTPDFDQYLAGDSPGAARETSSWPHYGGPGAAKYAELAVINRDNVANLGVAWTFRTGDAGTVFQATPILVDGLLVLCTPRNQVIALDPATGAERWRYDARIREGDYGNEINCRGVSQWHGQPEEACPARIFMATNDARLIALDASTGRACEAFGTGGEIDLQVGVGQLTWPGEYQVTSPPAVLSDRVIVGASISDNQRTDAPSGVVRGFDARTGALVWAFDLAPPGFDYASGLVSEAGYALATPNVWAPMSFDAARDMVFLPTGNPAPDYFRPATPDLDYFGSAIVALRASTGEYLWHFNTVLNDFWDFDVPSAPSLVDLTLDGVVVPALVQATKMGFVFVLHRETGEPLMDITYRDVPQGGPLEGLLAPQQPFPPEPFQVSRAYEPGSLPLGLCDELEAESAMGPVYAPITSRWTIGLPSNMGATNWGGVAVDPQGRIAVRTSNVPFRTRLIPKADVEDYLARLNQPDLSREERRSTWQAMRQHLALPDEVELASQRGTDYLMARHALVDPIIGIPCAGFPMAEMMVLDIASEAVLWRRPHGTVSDIAGVPLALGAPGMGGPLMTAGGLVFVGGAAENALRAYDAANGDELWQHALPFSGNATPMSYTVTSPAGTITQYVVIAAGGDARTGFGATGDYLVAFALPGLAD